MDARETQHQQVDRTGSFQAAVYRGSLWTVSQAVLQKGVTAVGTWVLAWYLTPDDFGVYAKALSVMVVATFFIPQCVSDLLVQRTERFRDAAGLGTTLALASGLLVAVICLGLGHPLEGWLDTPKLALVLGVLGFRQLAVALQVVPVASLRLQLRFGTLTTRALFAGIVGTCTAVGCAVAGVGTASIPLGTLAAFLAEAILQSRVAAVPWARPRLSGDSRLFADYTSLTSAQYLHNLTLYVDYAVLWFFVSTSDVGIYYFAFQLSTQVAVLLTHSLGRVLLPALSLLQRETPVQRQVFLRSVNVMLAVAVPVALLQAALAAPLLDVAFQQKWAPAARILMLLSVAQCFYSTSGPATAMLKAQGRFRTWTIWQSVKLSLMLPLLVAACEAASHVAPENGIVAAEACAAVVVLTYLVSGPVGVWLALGCDRAAARDTLRAHRGPLLAGVVLLVVSAPVSLLWQDDRWWLSLGLLVGVPLPAVAAYLAALRLTDPEGFRSLRDGVRHALHWLVRRSAPASV